MSWSRRQVLRGLGGVGVALPWLPSLAVAGEPTPRFFVALSTHHGGVWSRHMWPDDAVLSPAGRYAGRTLQRGTLSGRVEGDRRVLSDVLTADASRLTPALLARMNLLRGLDVPWYIAHHTGGHLGNFARNDGNGSDGLRMQAFPTPTIDQVMAWSDHVYPSLDGVVQRSIAVGERGMSWGLSQPSVGQGSIQPLHATWSNQALWRKLFLPGGAYGGVSPSLLDRVLGSYSDLRRSPRLAAADRTRLDEHMDRLRDIERRVQTQIGCAPASPDVDSRTWTDTPAYPLDPDAQQRAWQLHNDLIVAAFACGVTRVATMHVTETLSTFAGDWHNDIAHRAFEPDGEAQGIMTTAHQRVFEGLFVDLVDKLAAAPGPSGGSLLDDAVVVWSQECGQYTHHSYSMPVVMAGSAGGSLQTGQYLDYSDRDLVIEGPRDVLPGDHPGLLWNQYLGTLLRAMGVDHAGGYGPLWIAPDRPYYADSEAVVDEDLPLLT